MTAAHLLKPFDTSLLITQRETVESDEDGNLTLSKAAVNPIFVYELATGEKLTYNVVDETHLHIEKQFTDCLVDY
jgi:hypothetical protein